MKSSPWKIPPPWTVLYRERVKLDLSYLTDLRLRGIKAEAGLESSQWRGETGRIMTASGGVQGKVSDVQECAGCHKKIHDKFVLKVSKEIY